MPKLVVAALYTIMILVGLVCMYTIFNAGRPDSLLRPILPDPALDVYLALGSSFLIFVLGFFVFYSRDRQGIRALVEINAEKIRQMRQHHIADDVIADELLAAMGSVSGYRHHLARKKLILVLGEFR